jgi:hypothetical protein
MDVIFVYYGIRSGMIVCVSGSVSGTGTGAASASVRGTTGTGSGIGSDIGAVGYCVRVVVRVRVA